jgi:hypothetical protein
MLPEEPVRSAGHGRILQTTCPNVLANFLGDRIQTSRFGKIAVNLAVPGGIVTFPDKGGEFC